MALFKIRKMLLDSLFGKPATAMYPVVPRQWEERTRGHIEIDIDACIFCMICDKKCTTQAIAVDKKARTWAIERMRCIQCGCCVEVCPKKCLSEADTYTPASPVKIVDSFTGAPVAERPRPARTPREGGAASPAAKPVPSAVAVADHEPATAAEPEAE